MPTSDEVRSVEALIQVSNLYKTTSTGSESAPVHKKNVADWKDFYDSQVIPLRLEQRIMHATLLNEQQDLYSKNTTLTDNQHVQLGMVDRILSDFNNKGYGSMRKFQLMDYKINLKNLHITFIKYITLLSAIIFVMLGLTMMGLLDANLTVMMSTIIFIIFIIIVILNLKQNQTRRRYNWNNIHWKSPKSYPNSKSKTCKLF